MTEILTERRWHEMEVGQTYDLTSRYRTLNAFRAQVCMKGRAIGRKFKTTKKTGRFLVTRIA